MHPATREWTVTTTNARHTKRRNTIQPQPNAMKKSIFSFTIIIVAVSMADTHPGHLTRWALRRRLWNTLAVHDRNAAYTCTQMESTLSCGSKQAQHACPQHLLQLFSCTGWQARKNLHAKQELRFCKWPEAKMSLKLARSYVQVEHTASTNRCIARQKGNSCVGRTKKLMHTDKRGIDAHGGAHTERSMYINMAGPRNRCTCRCPD